MKAGREAGTKKQRPTSRDRQADADGSIPGSTALHPNTMANPHIRTERPSIGTPEGDNEFAPDQPLVPTEDGAEKIPRGFYQKDKTQAYKQDKPLK